MGLPTGDNDLQSSDSSDAEGEKATDATTISADQATDTCGAVKFGGSQGHGWEDDGAKVENAINDDGHDARKDGGDDGAVSTSMGENILDGTLVGGLRRRRVNWGGEGRLPE